MIKEISDGLKLVADGIKSIKTIADAVKEGRRYVGATHPEIKKDLVLMVEEMRKNLRVVSDASAVLTRFKFAIAPDTGSAELARFNNYFIKQQSKAADLREHVEGLQGHCSVIREHAENISGAATAEGFAILFEKLGLKSPKREKELGKKLDRLAYEDFEVARMTEIMLTCLDSALEHVQSTLGNDGAMHLKNVKSAASMLNEYARSFEKLEKPARKASNDIKDLVKELER